MIRQYFAEYNEDRDKWTVQSVRQSDDCASWVTDRPVQYWRHHHVTGVVVIAESHTQAINRAIKVFHDCEIFSTPIDKFWRKDFGQL